MPNDQFGRPVSVGNTVTVTGIVKTLTEDPNFVNCTVLLTQPMPPTMTEVTLNLNTAQVVIQPPPDGSQIPS